VLRRIHPAQYCFDTICGLYSNSDFDAGSCAVRTVKHLLIALTIAVMLSPVFTLAGGAGEGKAGQIP